MQNTLLRRFVRWMLATICASVMTDAAAAGSFTRGCAARDLQILKIIEERESTGTVPAEKLDDAMFAMMHARIVCHQGRVLEALALYDDIAESILPILSGRAHATGM